MTNEELARRIYAGEKELISILYLQNIGLIRKLAARYQNRHSERLTARGIDIDDLLQESYFVIPEAVKAFCKSSTGYKYTAFLSYPLLNRFNRLAGFRTQKERKEPLNTAVSLDMPLSDDTDDITLADTLPDDTAEFENDVIDNIALSELFPAVREALSNERQYTVIEQVYKYNKSQKDIGDMLGVSGSMVQQVRRAALRELRSYKHKKIMAYRQEYADIIDRSILRSTLSYFKNTSTSSVEWALLQRAAHNPPTFEKI